MNPVKDTFWDWLGLLAVFALVVSSFRECRYVDDGDNSIYVIDR